MLPAASFDFGQIFRLTVKAARKIGANARIACHQVLTKTT